MRTTSFRCTTGLARTSSSGAVRRVVAAVVEPDVDDDAPDARLPRQREETLRDVVRSVPWSAGSRGRRPCRPPASSATGRSSRSRSQTGSCVRRQRRRRAAERGRHLAGLDRLERGLGAVCERERRPCRLGHDPEASEDLRGGRGTPAGASGSPTRCRAARAAAPARRPRRSACRRSRSRAVPSGPRRRRSEPTTWTAVGEVVEPQRVDVQHRGRAGRRGTPRCGRRARRGARPGASPRRRARPCSARAPRRRASPPRPGTSRAATSWKRSGCCDLHRLGELAQLALERGRRPRLVAAGAACEKKGEHDDRERILSESTRRSPTCQV